MSFTDLQHVDPLASDACLGLWHKVAMRVPEVSHVRAVLCMFGVILAGAGAPGIFGTNPQGAQVVALLTTVVGGLLLIWRANIERDARHMTYLLKQRDRELATMRYRLRKYGITEEPTNE